MPRSGYPVDRLRKCHISGGSWTPTNAIGIGIGIGIGIERTMRRDTNDGRVPDQVFALLDAGINACPNVEAVILEQIGGAFATDEGAAGRWTNWVDQMDPHMVATAIELVATWGRSD